MTREEMRILYDDSYHSLYGYISSMIPREFAHDIIMDIFVSLFNNPRFESSREKAKSYLFRCAKNRCIDLRRKEKRNKEITSILLNPGELYGECQTVIDEDLGENEKIRIEIINNIKDIIDLMPGKRMKEVIKMSFIDGLPNKEISERLGVTSRTILNTKHTGVKIIKKQLQVA